MKVPVTLTGDILPCESVVLEANATRVAASREDGMAGTTQWQPEDVINGRYVIKRHVATGGMGELYEARQKGLDRDVAIKTIRREHTQKLDWLERFRREGLVLAKLDHPHVVRVYDLDEYEGNHYLVMEWLAGESLQKRLERTTTLSEPELVDVLLQACAGMVAVQELGVQHRDLKPDNLFLCEAPDGSLCVKVIDFGIASGDGSCTATNVTMGTPQYMSPEHFRGTQYVIDASDQYSMGVIAYRCAAGRTPCLIRGNTIAELTELARFMTEQRYPSLASLRPELSPALTAVVTHMMASNPKQRFASMRAVGAALLPLADDNARGLHARWFRSESVSAIVVAAPTPSDMPQVAETMTLAPGVVVIPPLYVTPPKRRRELWFALAAALIAVVAGGVVHSTRRRPTAPAAPMAPTRVEVPRPAPTTVPVSAPMPSPPIARPASAAPTNPMIPAPVEAPAPPPRRRSSEHPATAHVRSVPREPVGVQVNSSNGANRNL